MRKIILASSSPRRKQLLETAGFKVEVFPSNYEEDMTINLPPEELAKFLSKGKALDVVNNFEDAIVVSADTFVSFNGKIIGKPHTEENARTTLRMLSNNTHSVFTGFTIIDTKENKIISKAVETKVSFRELSDEMIDNYIKNGNPLRYAGSYTLYDVMDIFIEKIEGDYLNIIGLPVDEVVKSLKEFEVFTQS